MVSGKNPPKNSAENYSEVSYHFLFISYHLLWLMMLKYTEKAYLQEREQLGKKQTSSLCCKEQERRKPKMHKPA